MKIKAQLLEEWYQTNCRPLPWRSNKDPYRIWISEVMLQQTTVQAVVPYYERFLKKFKTVQELALANETEVLEMWSGLGYYSRARNLHKASRLIAELSDGFPRTAAALIQLPGFGPYTSRAVSSLAFNEAVGVLDGNVIRVLCRVFGLNIPWWKTKDRAQLQNLSDQIVQFGDPSILNQGLMELGATVCTPQSPNCVLCPWNKNCIAFQKKKVQSLPLKKPRKKSEVWIWRPLIIRKKNKIALVKNNYAPFLKNQWIFPGTVLKNKTKPKKFDKKHNITHHDIFIQVQKKSIKQKSSEIESDVRKKLKLKWVAFEQLKKINPSSLLQKVLQVTLVVFFFIPIVGCVALQSTNSNMSSSNKMPVQKTPNSSLNQNNDQIIVNYQIMGRQLTKLGDNQDATFSADGTRILYSSRNRSDHKNAQIYELDLETMREKRITYSDGDSLNPVYLENSVTLAYSSTTDEIKEHPALFSSQPKNEKGFEVYESDLQGHQILRLTKQVGDQMDLSISPLETHTLYYISRMNQNSAIYKMNLKTKTSSQVFAANKKMIRKPLIGKKGQFFWIEGQSSVGKQNFPFYKIEDISWWDFVKNQILITAESKPNQWGLFIYNLDGNCLQTVFDSKLKLAAASPGKEKKLLMTVFIDGHSQLFIKSQQDFAVDPACQPLESQ